MFILYAYFLNLILFITLHQLLLFIYLSCHDLNVEHYVLAMYTIMPINWQIVNCKKSHWKILITNAQTDWQTVSEWKSPTVPVQVACISAHTEHSSANQFRETEQTVCL